MKWKVPIPFGPGRIGIILFVGPGYTATRKSPVPLPVHPISQVAPRTHAHSPFPPSWLVVLSIRG